MGIDRWRPRALGDLETYRALPRRDISPFVFRLPANQIPVVPIPHQFELPLDADWSTDWPAGDYYDDSEIGFSLGGSDQEDAQVKMEEESNADGGDWSSGGYASDEEGLADVKSEGGNDGWDDEVAVKQEPEW
jgi:hypothetical protein